VLPSQAQQNKVRILYSQSIPTVVRQQIPRGGETKFFGIWQPENTKHAILVHFYSAPTKNEPLLCKVDIFQRLNRDSQSKLKQINSTRLDSNPELFKYVTANVPNTVVTLTYGADIVWANQKEKQKPLLRFHVVFSGYGRSGNYILINLANGWHDKANVQYFSWGGNVTESNVVIFDKTDKQGFMIVTVANSWNNGGDPYTIETDYYWNGETFSRRVAAS
jgi:hypothetical protein